MPQETKTHNQDETLQEEQEIAEEMQAEVVAEQDAETEAANATSVDLSEGERLLHQQLADLREQMKMMLDVVSNMQQVETMCCMNRFMELSQEAKKSRDTSFSLPSIPADALLRGAGNTLAQTAKSIKTFPGEMKASARKKVHKSVNHILNRVAGIYDKGIDALARQRANILSKAYVEKDSVKEAMEKLGDVVKSARENHNSVFEKQQRIAVSSIRLYISGRTRKETSSRTFCRRWMSTCPSAHGGQRRYRSLFHRPRRDCEKSGDSYQKRREARYVRVL